MEPKVLKLAPSGIPIGWLSLNDAATLVFKQQIAKKDSDKSISWTMGDDSFTLRGGLNSLTGKKSMIKIPAIMAVNESGSRGKNQMYLTFNADVCKYREGMKCAYCGNSFSRGQLTIDHIYPKSKGGLLTMENSIAACVKCNNKKADRTPEEANMPLLMKPFVPTMAEVMYMYRLGKVLDIQKEYLEKMFKNAHMRDYFSSEVA